MQSEMRSPQILNLTWGQLEIEGKQYFKDAKLFPGGAREWDWRETGTRHSPGIQSTDVAELLDNGATVVVLSKGMWDRCLPGFRRASGRHRSLEICSETLQTLEEKGIPVHCLQTELAVQLYNNLAETEPVGGLFHSTC